MLSVIAKDVLCGIFASDGTLSQSKACCAVYFASDGMLAQRNVCCAVSLLRIECYHRERVCCVAFLLRIDCYCREWCAVRFFCFGWNPIAEKAVLCGFFASDGMLS